MTEPAVSAAAALLDPLLPTERRAALADAVTRVRQGHARVLVLGEAQRALSTLDVAVLVVAADPPVSAAELELLAERRRSDGFDAFAAWLQGEIQAHGPADALASTARALRREANVLRDAVEVEEELWRRRGEHGQATLAALTEIVDRAGEGAHAAIDHLKGEAARLRRALDGAHDDAVAGALAVSGHVLAELSARGELSAEEFAGAVRSAVVQATRIRAHDWYAENAATLGTGMRQATGRALESLRAELAEARRAAGQLLRVELSEVAELPGPEVLRRISFEASVHPGWEELFSAALKRRLPARIRRRQVVRELDDWRCMAVPRPFGRARSTLQDSLREMARAAERSIEVTRAEYVSALQQGVSAVRGERDRSEGAIASTIQRLAQRSSDLDKILTLLGAGRGDLSGLTG